MSATLVERGAEIDALARCVVEAARGRGRVVVLEGPSGIGRTELLRAGREAARRSGLGVLAARGGEFERAFPYGVVRQLLEPLVAARADGWPPAPEPSAAALHQLHRLVVDLAARSGPTALFVDDVQWADPPSLAFLAFLGRRIDELPILLAVALRAGEPGADAARVAELVRGPLARSIRPAPLTVRGVAALVAARACAGVQGGFASACREATGGNPFLVTELAAALAEEGVRPIDAEIHRLRAIGPTTVAQEVMLRLARWPAPAAALAEAAALLGDEAELERAAALAGIDLEAARSAADALARADVIESRLPLRFRHPLVRAAIANDLGPARRAVLQLGADALHEPASALATASAWRGWANLHRGAVAEAEADLRQALILDTASWPLAVGSLAEALIEQDRLGEAGQLVFGAHIDGAAAESPLFEVFLGARGRLSAAAGRPDDALEDFLEIGRRRDARWAAGPPLVPWRSRAALAAAALGQGARAEELALEELRLARNLGVAHMIGRALRAVGLVAGGSERVRCLEEAVGELQGTPARLEHARALVDLGAALRQCGHRIASRDPLRNGLDLAHRCGAVALARRARRELLAAGARPRREVLSGPDALTASERRITAMAREGMSNKEIAHALYLSLRTVESHLSNAYRKLGVATRADLRRTVSSALGDHEAAASIPGR